MLRIFGATWAAQDHPRQVEYMPCRPNNIQVQAILLTLGKRTKSQQSTKSSTTRLRVQVLKPLNLTAKAGQSPKSHKIQANLAQSSQRQAHECLVLRWFTLVMNAKPTQLHQSRKMDQWVYVVAPESPLHHRKRLEISSLRGPTLGGLRINIASLDILL
jgi:hypothetical protein